MREERDGRRRGARYYPYGGDRAGPLPPCVRQGELSVSLQPHRLGLGASSEGRAAVNHWPAEEWPCKQCPVASGMLCPSTKITRHYCFMDPQIPAGYSVA